MATLLDTGNESRALTMVESMLEYAQNVHIPEHASTMTCLEKVVSALQVKKGAFKARHAAETMLAVCLPPFCFLQIACRCCLVHRMWDSCPIQQA